VFLTLIIIGTMFARSTLTAELSRSTAINRQGMIMGLNQSLMSGANISAPLVSGALIGHQLFVVWALAMAAIATIGVALARQFLAHARPARECFGHGSIASNP
jgi:MFS family permease